MVPSKTILFTFEGTNIEDLLLVNRFALTASNAEKHLRVTINNNRKMHNHVLNVVKRAKIRVSLMLRAFPSTDISKKLSTIYVEPSGIPVLYSLYFTFAWTLVT